MIILFIEDSYGISFFKKLIETMKTHNIIPKIRFQYKHLAAMCNAKTERLLKVAAQNPNYKKIFVIVDDDRTNGKKKGKEETHIPKKYGHKCELLWFTDEIEELILLSENIWHNGKSSDYLKTNRDYKKRDLPNYAKKLDLEKISTHRVISAIIQVAKNCHNL